MKIECILELMKDKGHIKMTGMGYDTMPMIWRIEICRGSKFGKKLFETIKEDNNYIIDISRTTYTELILCKKTDVDTWLKKFEERESSSRTWQYTRVDSDIWKYAKTQGYEIKKESYRNSVAIINLKLREERLERIEKENQEAIDLLDQLL